MLGPLGGSRQHHDLEADDREQGKVLLTIVTLTLASPGRRQTTDRGVAGPHTKTGNARRNLPQQRIPTPRLVDAT